MKPLVEICEYTGRGYHPVMAYQQWRVAAINHSEATAEENITAVARHLETDEVFILVSGDAVLYCADGEKAPTALYKIALERGKAFNVKAGTWHAMATSPGTSIFVVENDATGALNTVRAGICSQLVSRAEHLPAAFKMPD